MQILCRALGGRTGRSAKGWDIGVSCMHPTAAAARLFAPLKLPVHMPIIEFHQDEVCTNTLSRAAVTVTARSLHVLRMLTLL